MGSSCEWHTGQGKAKFPQLCLTGICVDGIFSEELRNTGENCTHSSECTSGSCGFSSFGHHEDSTPKCCGIGSYSIYDGVCDNEDYCYHSFKNGEQCSFQGSRYNELCWSNYCTIEGVCGNSNVTNNNIEYNGNITEYEHEHEDVEEDNNGSSNNYNNEYEHEDVKEESTTTNSSSSNSNSNNNN